MSNRIERVIITGAGSGIGFDLARDRPGDLRALSRSDDADPARLPR